MTGDAREEADTASLTERYSFIVSIPLALPKDIYILRFMSGFASSDIHSSVGSFLLSWLVC